MGCPCICPIMSFETIEIKMAAVSVKRSIRRRYFTAHVFGAKMAVCFVESKGRSGCGDFKGVNTLTSLHECRDDVSAHLKRFHLSNEN